MDKRIILYCLFFILFVKSSNSCPCELEKSTIYPGTKKWNCEGLNLVTIPGDCYEIESDVSELILSNNNIGSVRNIDFAGLYQLRALYLDYNLITFFDETALHQIDELEMFHGEQNPDLELPSTVFFQNKKLKEVILVGSHIKVLPSLTNTDSIQKLDARSCQLNSLPKTLFGSFSNISGVDVLINLYGNSIQEVRAETLLPIPDKANINLDTFSLIWAIDEYEYYDVLNKKWNINIDLETNLKVCQQDGNPTDESMCSQNVNKNSLKFKKY